MQATGDKKWQILDWTIQKEPKASLDMLLKYYKSGINLDKISKSFNLYTIFQTFFFFLNNDGQQSSMKKHIWNGCFYNTKDNAALVFFFFWTEMWKFYGVILELGKTAFSLGENKIVVIAFDYHGNKMYDQVR